MTQVPELLTARLALSAFRAEDARDVFAYARNPNVLRLTTAAAPRELAETEAFVRSLADSAPGSYAWAMRLREGGPVIGAIEFDTGGGTTGSIHYALAEEHWNKGLMTEACLTVLDWGFRAHPALQAVTTHAMAENTGSARVLEKCGFEQRGYTEETWAKFDRPVRLGVYTIDRSRWAALRCAGS